MKEKNSLLLIPKGRRPGIPQKEGRLLSHSFQRREQNAMKSIFTSQTKFVGGLIQSDIHHQMAANIGIQKTDNPQFQDITEPEAFIPIAKNPIIVCAPQLAVLELLKHPEEIYLG